MNKKSSARILDAVARDHVPQNLNLAPRIIAKVQRKGKGIRMQPRTKLVSAVLLAAIAIVVLFYTVPGVKAAIQRWFGYVPGIGLVHEGQIRVLAEPVSVTREGVTVTVEQVLLDSERTTLVYTAEGIPPDAFMTSPKEYCPYMVVLRLPDGSQATDGAFGSGGDAWATGYKHRINYGPVPANVNDATVEISCLFPTKAGSAPEDWRIPLHFVPAPPDMTAFPVIEISTPTAEKMPTHPPIAAAPSAAAPTKAADPDAITLTLDRAVQMDDGYLLYATLHWEDSPYTAVDIGSPGTNLRLLDASGQEMVYEFRFDEQTGLNVDLRQTGFVIKTAPVQAPGPLTLALDAVSIAMPVQDVTFTFDPGKDPQPGQTWRIDKVLQIGEHRLNIHSARTAGTGYIYEMSSDSGIMYAMLADFDHPVVAGGGGGGGGELGQKFESGFYYEKLVNEPITIHVTEIATEHPQALRATWTPPVASTSPLPTQASSCLNAAAWKAAKALPQAIPDGLGGKLIVSGPINANGDYGMWLSSLDGSNPQILPGAQGGSFSPDGKTLAYSTLNDGILLRDLASGQDTHLQGTSGGDFNPLWSPDGTQIVFNRGQGLYDLFITSLDGSEQKRLTQGGMQEWPSGWLPDGSLLYVVPGRDNQYTTYRLDVTTGASAVYMQANVASIAPDGAHMLTTEKVFGDRWLTYLSELDGSNRWLLASDELWVMTPQWSPDGHWLLAAVSDTTADKATGALINPRTCQVIALPGLKGSFYGWVK